MQPPGSTKTRTDWGCLSPWIKNSEVGGKGNFSTKTNAINERRHTAGFIKKTKPGGNKLGNFLGGCSFSPTNGKKGEKGTPAMGPGQKKAHS